MATTMETNNGRCGPLCQHPGCWDSSKKRATSARHTQYSRYLQELLRLRCSSADRARTQDGERGLPVLTVQSLAVEGVGAHDTTTDSGTATITTSHITHPPSSPAPHPPHMHRVEVLLEAAAESSSSLTFSPVLIWRPGRLPAKLPSIPLAGRLQGQQPREGRGSLAVKTQNLTDALPPGSASREGQRKARLRSVRPHSRLHHYPESLDYLHDMPPHIVAEILHQLRSESSSTLTAHSHPATPTPTPISQPTESSANATELTHVPASLVCDLSTGQLYSTAPGHATQPDIHIPRPVPATPLPEHTPPPARAAPSAGVQRKRSKTLPAVQGKTSFSRELSRRPLSALRRSKPAHVSRPPDTSVTLPSNVQTNTTHQALLPISLPPPPLNPLTHPPSSLRYPLGNPLVPRMPPDTPSDPFLAPYRSQQSTQKSSRRRESLTLQVCPASVHNARLVTLHYTGKTTRETHSKAVKVPSAITRPFSEDSAPLRTVHLPPISNFPTPLPSSPAHPTPSPPTSHPSSPTCVSPDHMHVGAEIRGDQLVLERGGEQVVHPLRDTSQASMGGASGVEATPPLVGVTSGSQAPPPTATEEVWPTPTDTKPLPAETQSP